MPRIRRGGAGPDRRRSLFEPAAALPRASNRGAAARDDARSRPTDDEALRAVRRRPRRPQRADAATAAASSQARSSSVREPRHVRAVPTSIEHKISSAVDLFNASEHPRTVAGIARSLGLPEVSVLPPRTLPSVVQLVVVVGAVLVPLRGRPVRRGAERPGLRTGL